MTVNYTILNSDTLAADSYESFGEYIRTSAQTCWKKNWLLTSDTPMAAGELDSTEPWPNAGGELLWKLWQICSYLGTEMLKKTFS